MAISIMPIAGPDLVEEDGTIKSLKEFYISRNRSDT